MSDRADSRSDDYGERVIRNEERLVALAEETRLRFEARDRALAGQAAEYERRLDGLNHENERILAAQDQSVSADKFDGHLKG
jgi:hypothetical protein